MYMNKGLELFKDDDSVTAICGYRHYYPIKTEANTFFRISVEFSAWGYGSWSHKRIQLRDKYTWKWFRRACLNPLYLYRAYKTGTRRLCNLLGAGQPWIGDFWVDWRYATFQSITKRTAIMPTVAVSTTRGLDASGVNMGHEKQETVNRIYSQKLSDETDFDFIGTGYEYFKENNKSFAKNMHIRSSFRDVLRSIYHFAKNNIKYIIRHG